MNGWVGSNPTNKNHQKNCATLDRNKAEDNINIVKKVGQQSQVLKGLNDVIKDSQEKAQKFYNDGMFALCQAAENGWIEATEATDKQIKNCAALKSNETEDNKPLPAENIKMLWDWGKQSQILEERGPRSSDRKENFKKLEKARTEFDIQKMRLDETTKKMKAEQNYLYALKSFLEEQNIGKPDKCTEFEIQMFQLRKTVENIMVGDAGAEKAKAEARTAEAKLELEKLKEKNSAGAKKS